MLYAGLRRGGTAGQIELLRRAPRQAKQPWQSEDAPLTELPQREDALGQKADPPPAPAIGETGEVAPTAFADDSSPTGPTLQGDVDLAELFSPVWESRDYL